jgi:hypothetical protein
MIRGFELSLSCISITDYVDTRIYSDFLLVPSPITKPSILQSVDA